jgi:cell division protein FtsB
MAQDRFGSEEAQAERARLRRRRIRLVATCLGVLALASVLGNRSLVQVYQMNRARAALEAEIGRLKEANAALAREVRSLQEDPERLEGSAREDLGLVKPGESVYQFRREAPPAGR